MDVHTNLSSNSSKKDPIGAAEHVEEELKGLGIVPTERTVIPPGLGPIEKRLRRKYDFRILLPTMLIWLMAYVDRSNMGNALILGMADDVGLTSDQLNVALSAFFVVYIVFEM